MRAERRAGKSRKEKESEEDSYYFPRGGERERLGAHKDYLFSPRHAPSDRDAKRKYKGVFLARQRRNAVGGEGPTKHNERKYRREGGGQKMP